MAGHRLVVACGNCRPAGEPAAHPLHIAHCVFRQAALLSRGCTKRLPSLSHMRTLADLLVKLISPSMT